MLKLLLQVIWLLVPYLAPYVLICVILILIRGIFYTLSHELGHALTANHFQRTDTKIELYSKIRLPLRKSFGFPITYTKKKLHKGFTDLENNYQPYNNIQIIKIAKAGHLGGLIYTVINILILFISIFLIPYSKVLFLKKIYIILFIGFSVMLLVLHFRYIISERKNYEIWPDLRIIKDPSGFRKYYPKFKESNEL